MNAGSDQTGMKVIAERLPSKEEFTDQVNSVFRADLNGGGAWDFHLVKIESLISNTFQESFSILFRAPADVPAFQNIYRLDNETLGEMDLFLVPVNRDEAGVYFEAVFNHLRAA